MVQIITFKSAKEPRTARPTLADAKKRDVADVQREAPSNRERRRQQASAKDEQFPLPGRAARNASTGPSAGHI
jgi:hypothetical protein